MARSHGLYARQAGLAAAPCARQLCRAFGCVVRQMTAFSPSSPSTGCAAACLLFPPSPSRIPHVCEKEPTHEIRRRARLARRCALYNPPGAGVRRCRQDRHSQRPVGPVRRPGRRGLGTGGAHGDRGVRRPGAGQEDRAGLGRPPEQRPISAPASRAPGSTGKASTRSRISPIRASGSRCRAWPTSARRSRWWRRGRPISPARPAAPSRRSGSTTATATATAWRACWPVAAWIRYSC